MAFGSEPLIGTICSDWQILAVTLVSAAIAWLAGYSIGRRQPSKGAPDLNLPGGQSDIHVPSEVGGLKTEFLAICSHELKTPLVSIMGYLDLISSGKLGPLTPRQENALRVSIRNAGRLKELLSTLLDLARMEAGKMLFEFTPQRLGAMFEDLVATVHPMAEEKGVSIEIEPQSDLPLVTIDASLLHRVFLNLLDNSIKFTPSGGRIVIRADARNDIVHVEINDTGVGIRPTDIDRVKEPFFQSDASDTRTTGGLGLGLAIVERILRGHGTRLSIESIQGKGTRVGFSLKVAKKTASGRFLAIDPAARD